MKEKFLESRKYSQLSHTVLFLQPLSFVLVLRVPRTAIGPTSEICNNFGSPRSSRLYMEATHSHTYGHHTTPQCLKNTWAGIVRDLVTHARSFNSVNVFACDASQTYPYARSQHIMERFGGGEYHLWWVK